MMSKPSASHDGVTKLSSMLANLSTANSSERAEGLLFRRYQGEQDLPAIMGLIEGELSEPYIIYTYRYFLREWPQLCFLCFAYPEPSDTRAEDSGTRKEIPVGAILCKQDIHRGGPNRGYIGMLTTSPAWRKRGIARKLVHLALDQMVADGAQEIVLETEFDNVAALSFYASLGFIREKRLYAFYLNRKDAFRLIRVVQ